MDQQRLSRNRVGVKIAPFAIRWVVSEAKFEYLFFLAFERTALLTNESLVDSTIES